LKKSKKNPIPSHTEKFHDFYFKEEKKNPQLLLLPYWLCLSSYQTQLSVYLTKNNNNKRINKHTKNNRKTPFTWYTVCFFGHYTTIPYLQSPISQVFSTILYYSPEKKIMFWPKRNKKTNIIITNKGTAFPKKKIIEFEKNKNKNVDLILWVCL